MVTTDKKIVTVRGKVHTRVSITRADGSKYKYYTVCDVNGHSRILSEHKSRLVIAEVERAIAALDA